MELPNPITEGQIIKLKSKLNDKQLTCSELDFPELPVRGVSLTEEQTLKAIAWLRKAGNKQYFGFRELAILADFKEFRLIDFKDCALYGAPYPQYYPVYRVVSKTGDTFDYYYDWHRIHITG